MMVSMNKREKVRDSLLVISLAVLVLFAWSVFEETGHLHLSTPLLTDQISYITTARNVLDHQGLNNNLIYLEAVQLASDYSKNTYYMPGYPAILALSFKVLGYGPIQAILPSLLAYIASAWIVYLIGIRIFNRKTGWIAALLFLCFPTNIFFSFFAMAEIMLVFFSLLAFYLFLCVRQNLRWLAGPFLIGMAFLIRESAALLVALFALFMLMQGGKKQWKAVLLFCVVSLGVLFLIYFSPLSSGRFPSTIYFKLVSTVNGSNPAALSSGNFLQVILGVARQNLQSFQWPVAKDVMIFGTTIGIAFLSLLYGWVRKQNMHFYLPVFVLVFLIACAVFFFYTLDSFRGLRHMMYAIPFALVSLGAVLADSATVIRKQFRFIPGIVIAIFIVSCMQQTAELFTVLAPAGQTDYEQLTVQAIESVGHDDEKVLVAPLNFAITYMDEHYPLKLAFVPESDEIFELLYQKYEIGTIIYPVPEEGDEPGYITRMEEYGFTQAESFQFNGVTYLVFKH